MKDWETLTLGHGTTMLTSRHLWVSVLYSLGLWTAGHRSGRGSAGQPLPAVLLATVGFWGSSQPEGHKPKHKDMSVGDEPVERSGNERVRGR